MTAPAKPPEPRLCLLAGSYYPTVGGGERHARLICRELAAKGIEVHVVTRRRTADLPALEEFEGCTIHRVGPTGFPRCGKYLMLPAALWKLWRLRKSYDIIGVAGLRVLGHIAMPAQWLWNKPCVLRSEACGELNGEFIWKTPSGRIHLWKKWIFRPLVRLRNIYFKAARCFLAVSTPIHDEFIECGVQPGKIEDIPNGYDPADFPPRPDSAEDIAALRRKLSLPEDGLLFTYSGKLNRGKGLDLLLRVWTRFAATRTDVHLVLVGSGKGQYLSCENELRHDVELNQLQHSVHFTGYVADVADYLRASDAFVFPSESEAQGLAVLEAMACGLPVFASRIPGIMDMLDDGVNGCALPPRDDDAWLNALEQFAADPAAYQPMARAAYQNAIAHYTIADIAERHLVVFRRLFHGR